MRRVTRNAEGMDSRVVSIAEILRLNTRLFRNCLEGMSEAQALARPTTYTNSAGFVAAHVTDSRYHMLEILGEKRPCPLAPYVGKAKSIDDIDDFPPLDLIHSAWSEVSHGLRDRLISITSAELEAAVETRIPLPDKSALGIITFLAQHDSFHVGQLALLRKYVGLPAMRY